MDPKETLILLLLALARNERAEAQDYADNLSDWLAREGFTPTVDEAFLQEFRRRLYDGTANPPAYYVLGHEHKYGKTLYPFVFIPTQECPSPLIRPIAQDLLDSDFEPDKDETLELEQLNAPNGWTVFTGPDYANATGQGFLGEDDEEIILGESDDDGEEESSTEEYPRPDRPTRFVDEEDGN